MDKIQSKADCCKQHDGTNNDEIDKVLDLNPDPIRNNITVIKGVPSENISSNASMDMSPKLWNANKCDSSMMSKNIIKSSDAEHTDTNIKVDNIKWHCISCPAVVQTLNELKSHYKYAHHRSPNYKCNFCCKIYSRYNSFMAHVTCHNKPKLYECEICGKSFTQKTVLLTHSSVHTNERPHICVQCGKSFKQFSSLYCHVKNHTTDKDKLKFTCSECNKQFSSKHTLESHNKIHTGLRDYICDICGKRFIAKGSLNYHILTHSSDKRFVCNTCGKGFKTSRLLSKHSTLHTGVKPHKCDTCGKLFREKGPLREHKRIHTGAMPYTCQVCGKTFRFKGILTVHTRQHTGERPYSCTECNRSFTNWPNCNKHMKRRHKFQYKPTNVSGRNKYIPPPVQLAASDVTSTPAPNITKLSEDSLTTKATTVATAAENAVDLLENGKLKHLQPTDDNPTEVKDENVASYNLDSITTINGTIIKEEYLMNNSGNGFNEAMDMSIVRHGVGEDEMLLSQGLRNDFVNEPLVVDFNSTALNLVTNHLANVSNFFSNDSSSIVPQVPTYCSNSDVKVQTKSKLFTLLQQSSSEEDLLHALAFNTNYLSTEDSIESELLTLPQVSNYQRSNPSPCI